MHHLYVNRGPSGSTKTGRKSVQLCGNRKRWRIYVQLSVCVAATFFSASPEARNSPQAGEASYRSRAALGIQRLQSWYDPATGLYRTTGWWNSANAITTLADYSRVTGDKKYDGVFPDVFVNAQHTSAGFLNNFYDDEGWWALAWIDAYDLLHEQRYLQVAASIFNDMAKGWDETCSGGIWWSKDRKYKNAIANELFLSVAAHLAMRTRSRNDRRYYLQWAQREWQWFSRTGMINPDHQINDGLDAACVNNHKTTWSYNQGVILGGLSELYKRTQDQALLAEANAIAAATLSSPMLSDEHGILHDPCEPDCGGDGTQFKGIFVRNLALLYKVAPSPRLKTFVLTNADSIWKGMHPPTYDIGTRWTAPYGPVNASSQSSGDDALVAAVSMGAH
jgi:predicted alpha-1,6-mannanase (GH76 family)